MPLTPFHLGPGLFFGMLSFRFIDLTAFLLGSVVLDIEPFFALITGNIRQPHHFFTCFLGGILGAIIVLTILNVFKSLRFPRHSSNLRIFFSGLIGCWIHIIFDSFMHYDVSPFWPFDFNPFLNLISISQNYFLCIILGVIGLGLLMIKIIKTRNK